MNQLTIAWVHVYLCNKHRELLPPRECNESEHPLHSKEREFCSIHDCTNLCEKRYVIDIPMGEE